MVFDGGGESRLAQQLNTLMTIKDEASRSEHGTVVMYNWAHFLKEFHAPLWEQIRLFFKKLNNAHPVMLNMYRDEDGKLEHGQELDNLEELIYKIKRLFVSDGELFAVKHSDRRRQKIPVPLAWDLSLTQLKPRGSLESDERDNRDNFIVSGFRMDLLTCDKYFDGGCPLRETRIRYTEQQNSVKDVCKECEVRKDRNVYMDHHYVDRISFQFHERLINLVLEDFEEGASAFNESLDKCLKGGRVMQPIQSDGDYDKHGSGMFVRGEPGEPNVGWQKEYQQQWQKDGYESYEEFLKDVAAKEALESEEQGEEDT